LNDVPQDVEIQIIVAMHQSVSKPRYFGPGYLGMDFSSSLRYAGGRFAHYEYKDKETEMLRQSRGSPRPGVRQLATVTVADMEGQSHLLLKP
jgi:hypothetical protein